jgi:hypothetical protein
VGNFFLEKMSEIKNVKGEMVRGLHRCKELPNKCIGRLSGVLEDWVRFG